MSDVLGTSRRPTWSFRPDNERDLAAPPVHDAQRPRGSGASLRYLVTPLIPCERQERALRTRLPAVSTTWTRRCASPARCDGGPLDVEHDEHPPRDDVVQGRAAPQPDRASTTRRAPSTASGPTGVPTVLLTRSRSARTNGLELEAQPARHARRAAHRHGHGPRCARRCPTKFDVHRTSTSTRREPFSAVTDHRLDRPKGIEILNLFKPRPSTQLVRPPCGSSSEETAERGTASNPQLGSYERLEITLELQRCKRQSPPARCGARR